jgi:hypothetical protein
VPIAAGVIPIDLPRTVIALREVAAHRRGPADAVKECQNHGRQAEAKPDKLLFRGLIAGSLSRHLALLWANLAQALIFLVPHFLILLVMPKMWPVLPLVFLGALTLGWVRIKSGSILGSWLMHGTGNVAMALIVAVRTSG